MLFVFSQPRGYLTRKIEAGTPWATIAGQENPRCDPYLVWFDLTYDAGADGPSGYIDILLELPPAAVSSAKLADQSVKELQDAYGIEIRTNPVPNVVPQRFMTAFLPIANLPALAWDVAHGKRNLGFELATARYVSPTNAEAMTKSYLVDSVGPAVAATLSLPEWRTRIGTSAWSGTAVQVVPFFQALNINRWQLLAEQLASQAPVDPPPPPLVAVIDDFCNHACHGLAGRVRSIWHQGHLRVPDDVGGTSAGALARATDRAQRAERYGVIQQLRSSQVDRTVAAPAPLMAPDERHAYSHHGRDKLTPSWSHGSAVLSMLKRRDGPAVPCASPDGLDALKPPEDIDFIQLPDVAVFDTSGGSLGGFALDAIHRALYLACEPAPRKAVIVNLSFGTHSGPHDGSSMFERAVVELMCIFDGTVKDHGILGTRRLPALHVVLPSGNTHQERTHASGSLSPAMPAAELRWMILPDTETDSFIEVWLDGDSAAVVEIELLPPGSDDGRPSNGSAMVAPGGVQMWGSSDDFDKGVLHAAVIYPKTTSKGQNGRMALIAVAPTQQRANQGLGETYRSAQDGAPATDDRGQVKDALWRRRMQAAPGCWTVRLRNPGNQPVQFHAWIQRHDTAPGRRRASKGYQGRQSYFVDAGGTHVDPHFTFNAIATAKHPGQLWVVGAMDERGGMPLYSAAGPDRLVGARVEGPDVVTTVDRSRNFPGRHVNGVFSGSRLRLGGTSIAAAAFTRMLYHTLELGGPMAWCTPREPAPPPVETAETPASAEDWMRGSDQRLRHQRDLAVHGPSCKDRPRDDDAPESCLR